MPSPPSRIPRIPAVVRDFTGPVANVTSDNKVAKRFSNMKKATSQFVVYEQHKTACRGIFADQEIKPIARTLAEDRGIECVVVDYDDLRGHKGDELSLFIDTGLR